MCHLLVDRFDRLSPLTFALWQVNGGAGQEPLPVAEDQPGGAGGGAVAETVQRLGQQVSLSEQVTPFVSVLNL